LETAQTTTGDGMNVARHALIGRRLITRGASSHRQYDDTAAEAGLQPAADLWGGPDEPAAEACSYCDAPVTLPHLENSRRQPVWTAHVPRHRRA
jgi:hypothetical protein